MAQNITLLGANYPDVPAVTLPITGGGTATFSDTRSVTYNLTGGATASVTPSEAVTGQGFSVKLKAPTGYALSGVTVTMGGNDITSQVFTPDAEGGGGANLQTKSVSYTPTASAQTAQVTADSGYDGLEQVNVTVGAMPSGTAGTPTATKGSVSNHSVTVTPSVTNSTGYITGGTKTGTAVTVSASELVSGSETKTANGTYDVTNLAELVVNVSGGGGKNIQVYSGRDEVNTTDYSATDVSITVSKAGTYKCSWMGFRNTTSGTNGSRLYKNGTAVGSAHTSGWTRSYGQYCEETLTLAVGDVLTVYARARATNYYMNVGNLIIQEQ